MYIMTQNYCKKAMYIKLEQKVAKWNSSNKTLQQCLPNFYTQIYNY